MTHPALTPAAGTTLEKQLKPVDLPADILAQRPAQVVTDTKGFQFAPLFAQQPGEYALINRISSHRDVGAKYYAEVAKERGLDLGGSNAGY